MPMPGTPGIPGMVAIGDMDVGVDMGGAMGIEICMGIGIEPGAVPIIGRFAPGVDAAGPAVAACNAEEGEPKAAGDPAGKPGVPDKADEPITPADPKQTREEGSGLWDAPSPPAALDTIIL